MNFKRFGIGRNILPSPTEQTIENNGITYRTDGQGRFYMSGTATNVSSALFNISNFTIPVSVGQGGNGTFSMFNTGTINSNVALRFQKNNTLVDEWTFGANNRTNTVYKTMGNQEINQIAFRVPEGATVNITTTPMFTNDGQLPAEFEPHMVWHDIPYYQHKTATDTLTLPAVIYPNASSITVGIKGNTTQSGTPSPSNPVDVNGTGERTGNLFDKDNVTDINDNKYINQSGTIVKSNDYYISYPIAVDANSNYTWKFNEDSSGGDIRPAHSAPTVGFYDNNDNLLSVATHSAYVCYFSFTTPSNCAYIRASVYKSFKNEAVLNVGTTPINYQPYGYKIPILSGGTTTPVYLGEVQTARQIKKLVLTGQEPNWNVDSTNLWHLYINDVPATPIEGSPSLYCTHYEGVESKGVYSGLTNGKACIRSSGNYIWIRDSQFANLNAFKAWLAQQYANGTPVCVYYVLATPQTATVNEPLMKIGTYADSLTTSIPCTAGENSFDVQTTVAPSEVSAGFSGWHPVADVHERNSGAWT
jgi:hypothetical protein